MNEIALKKESSRTAKILALFLWGLALLIFFGLVSNYSEGWSTGTTMGEISKGMGIFNTLSGRMVYLIGINAYLIPPLLVLIAWRVFFSLRLRTSTNFLLGVCLLLPALSGLISIFLNSGIYGGLLGEIISARLLSIFDRSGVIALLLVIISISLVLVSNYRFLPIVFQLNHALDEIRQWQEREHAAARNRLAKRMQARRLMNKLQV